MVHFDFSGKEALLSVVPDLGLGFHWVQAVLGLRIDGHLISR